MKIPIYKTLEIARIKLGMRCMDLGCGIGKVTRLMGSLVGRDGTVVGLGMNSEAINIGNKKANEKTDYNNIWLTMDVCGRKNLSPRKY